MDDDFKREIEKEIENKFGKDISSIIYKYIFDKCHICCKKYWNREIVNCQGCNRYTCNTCYINRCFICRNYHNGLVKFCTICYNSHYNHI